MKKSTIFIITFIFLAVFICFSIYYAKVYKPAHTPEQTSAVYVANGMERKKTGNRILLAELAEDDIHLYYDGGYTILVHEGRETEFDNWSKMIAEEKPELYYIDFNGDKQKDILVRALEGTDEKTKEKYYCVYVITVTKDENENYKYEIFYANRSTWYSIFDQTLNRQTSQPIYNPKRIQFVMNLTTSTISYDSTTGIANNSRAWYVKALSDGKNNYYTLKDWYIGTPILTVDTKEPCINVQANYYITYNETDEVQLGGKLNCGLSLTGRDFKITNKSVKLIPAPEYTVTSLLKLADKDWNYTFKNTAPYSSSDKIIDNTTFKCTMQSTTPEESTIFSGDTEEAKALDRITLTKNSIKLYAKSGYRFSEDVINKLKYSVTVNVNGVNADITLSASLNEENGTSVLTFVLDKDYPKTELERFVVNLGQ